MSAPKKSVSNAAEDKFWIEWHNKVLLRRINGAKSTLNTKPFVAQVKHTRRLRDEIESKVIDEKNDTIARRLSAIYARKNQYSEPKVIK